MKPLIYVRIFGSKIGPLDPLGPLDETPGTRSIKRASYSRSLVTTDFSLNASSNLNVAWPKPKLIPVTYNGDLV